MKLDPARWLPRLRAAKRAVLCAVIPALALTSAAGMACTASSAAPLAEHSEHSEHADHGTAATHGAATHHGASHGEHPAAPEQQPCPHCPLESGAANVGHAACAIDDGQDGGGTAPGKCAVEHQPPLAYEWVLPAARAAPPLIAASEGALPVAAIPLTLRFCSLLI